MCGEQSISARFRVSANGSSPRVRGTAESRLRNDGTRRFIPACAGNSPKCRLVHSSPTVHPRVCGEQWSVVSDTPCPVGSSPRVRGTVLSARETDFDARFIPACAGNSVTSRSSPAALPVHPRVCGEQDEEKAEKANDFGSSPRVRGTVAAVVLAAAPRRFIPACAGNRHIADEALVVTTVHPRVCGEQQARPEDPWRKVGSSPRVRGTVTIRSSKQNPRRFIPACAGNSYPAKKSRKGHSVHPRVCGEQSRRTISAFTVGGSSPRVRGTACCRSAAGGRDRFIPACAGNRCRFYTPRYR